MFPFDIEEADEVDVVEDEVPLYREYEIDYATGQLTGRIVEGAEAVKVWIYLALNTDRYHYGQYSWDYGSELGSLVGKSSDPEYISMEAKRIVTECIEQNQHIAGVKEFRATVGDEKINISCIVETDYGEVGIDV